MLRDLRGLFGSREELFTETILTALWEMEDRSWPEWKNGKPISAKQLASLLKRFEKPDGAGPISPEQIRIGEESKKGYKAEWFTDAWARYLPPPEAKQAKQWLNHAENGQVTIRNTKTDVSDNEQAGNPHGRANVSDVSDRKGGLGPEGGSRTTTTTDEPAVAELIPAVVGRAESSPGSSRNALSAQVKEAHPRVRPAIRNAAINEAVSGGWIEDRGQNGHHAYYRTTKPIDRRGHDA
jgi:hypothetical protein